jgi:hypothetical protein
LGGLVADFGRASSDQQDLSQQDLAFFMEKSEWRERLLRTAAPSGILLNSGRKKVQKKTSFATQAGLEGEKEPQQSDALDIPLKAFSEEAIAHRLPKQDDDKGVGFQKENSGSRTSQQHPLAKPLYPVKYYNQDMSLYHTHRKKGITSASKMSTMDLNVTVGLIGDEDHDRMNEARAHALQSLPRTPDDLRKATMMLLEVSVAYRNTKCIGIRTRRGLDVL